MSGEIIDRDKKWYAVIEDYGDGVFLSFRAVSKDMPIQGYVDDALEKKYGWEIETGIDGLTLEPDDGSFNIYCGDHPEPEKAKVKAKEFLIDFNNKNKKLFVKRIKKDFRHNDYLKG